MWVLDLHALNALLYNSPVMADRSCPYCPHTKKEWRTPSMWCDSNRRTLDFFKERLIEVERLEMVVYDPMHLLTQVPFQLCHC